MLEMLSQIKTSRVERIYPDILRITISEHKPFAKVLLKVDYQNRIYLLSNEGSFFSPISIDEDEINALKYIEGIKIVFDGNVPAKYKSIHKLVEFVSAVKSRLPEEFDSWLSIDVSQIDSITLPIITITTQSGIKYIFKTNQYTRQIDRLEYILKYMKDNPIEKVEKIDLTYEDSSIVKIAKPQTK